MTWGLKILLSTLERQDKKHNSNSDNNHHLQASDMCPTNCSVTPRMMSKDSLWKIQAMNVTVLTIFNVCYDS